MPGNAEFASLLPDELGGGEQRVVEVVASVFGAKRGSNVPPTVLVLGRGSGDLVGEETTCRRAVGVKGNVVIAKDTEQALFTASADGVVLALIHGWFHKAVVLADLDHLFDLFDGEVGQAKAFKLALEIGFVHGLGRLGERSGTVGGMQVHDIDLVGVEGFQGAIDTEGNVPGPMRTGHETGDLARDVGPFRQAQLPFTQQLLACATTADWVGSGGIDVVVASGVKQVDKLGCIFDGGDFGERG